MKFELINDKLVDFIREGNGYVGIMAGSPSDEPHVEEIVQGLEKFQIPYGVHIGSAHKQPLPLDQYLDEYNSLNHPVLLVAVAAGTDALSGTASWKSNHPVLSCPPDAPNQSCEDNPPGSSNAYTLNPSNVGVFANQMFNTVALEGTPSLDVISVKDSEEGSTEDSPNLKKVYKNIDKFPSMVVRSFQCATSDLNHRLANYDNRDLPSLLLALSEVGDLSPEIYAKTKHPLVVCPTPQSYSSGTSDGLVYMPKPGNAARFATQMFSSLSAKCLSTLEETKAKKIQELEKANQEVGQKYLDRCLKAYGGQE